MSLKDYFTGLISKVENSETISNGGKDDNGFYKPTKNVLIQNLNLLKDLHNKPGAKAMVQASWKAVVKDLPPEWLILDDQQKSELKKILT
ncbi:MAG: hypothetical protein H7256_06160 [Bdellovibrio sp.]|nr:hypothetical protein [Bdellovibrio sp.]